MGEQPCPLCEGRYGTFRWCTVCSSLEQLRFAVLRGFEREDSEELGSKPVVLDLLRGSGGDALGVLSCYHFQGRSGGAKSFPHARKAEEKREQEEPQLQEEVPELGARRREANEVSLTESEGGEELVLAELDMVGLGKLQRIWVEPDENRALREEAEKLRNAGAAGAHAPDENSYEPEVEADRKKRKRSDDSSGRASSSSKSEEEPEELFGCSTRPEEVGRRFPGVLAAEGIREMRASLLKNTGQLWDLEDGPLPPLSTMYFRQTLMSKMAPPMARETHTLCYGIKSLEGVAAGLHYSVMQKMELLPMDASRVARYTEEEGGEEAMKRRQSGEGSALEISPGGAGEAVDREGEPERLLAPPGSTGSVEELCREVSEVSPEPCYTWKASDQLMPFLAEHLRRQGLWGESGWAPDQLLLHSGGPVTDVAQNSLLAGPATLRFLARQPPEPKEPHAKRRHEPDAPLEGQLRLLRPEERLPLQWHAQRWRGTWEALPEMPPQQCLGDALRQVAEEAKSWEADSMVQDLEDGQPVRSSLAGLLGYDLVQWTQPLALDHLPEEGALLGVLYRVDRWLVHQRSKQQLLLVAPPGDVWACQAASCLRHALDLFGAEVSPPAVGQQVEALRSAPPPLQRLQLLLRHLRLSPEALREESSKGPVREVYSSIDDAAHMKAVHQVQEAIRAGHFYQLNFGRAWQGELQETPWELMQKLFRQNAAPYAGFLQAEEMALCCCSPELLLGVDEGRISSCPIKGTCARSLDSAEDAALRSAMVASPKEVAEHIMLVDLERHDLGLASVPSSVAWERWRVEILPNIQHLVSKVSGQLRPNSDVWAALESIFPGGSITGCPKTACIAAIDALEQRPRRSWTGSLGFADLFTGDGQWNILIRTLEAQATKDAWHGVVKAGGGLTIGDVRANGGRQFCRASRFFTPRFAD
ncbi:unnamed protein product [Effrenium voratum]|nr:unnamed protein product [Effrenium voratum]